MGAVQAAITMSVDGYVTGPVDGPGRGLGVGGERLHHWVFGRPWTYAEGPGGQAEPDDAAWLERSVATAGAVICGRTTYEAAGGWGGTNPWPVPLLVVTHRPEEEPATGGFTFVGGIDEALARARELAAGKDVNVMGGASVIRQTLAAGAVDRLTIVLAPVVLGGGKRLFDGFSQSLDLQQLGVRQSTFATFVDYGVRPATG